WVVPTAVPGLTGATALAAGDAHTCALRKAGDALCWGDGRDGRLGDGTGRGGAAPRAATGTAGAKAIAAGQSHTCVVRPSGEVACWGSNAAGQSTVTAGGPVMRPKTVPIGGVVSLSAGEAHTCAVTGDGHVRCWGAAAGGRLGHGSPVPG